MFFKPFVLNNLYTQVLSYLRIDTSLEKRTYGFKDGCSRLVEMEENLKLPAGYEWQGKEKRDQMDGSGAGFTGYMGQNGNQLQVKTSLRLKKTGLRKLPTGKVSKRSEHSQGIWRIYCGKEITTHSRI